MDCLKNAALFERSFAIKPTRSHVVISGTGRAGTTFLIELLTCCGLDTGFNSNDILAHKDPIARAGLEHDIRNDSAPYIVKSPWFCDYAENVLARDDIRLEHVLVPMRDLFAAAESRRYVQAKQLSQLALLSRLSQWIQPQTFPGGLWRTTHDEQQESILLHEIYKLTYALSSHAVPVTLLQYPRIATDSVFLYKKIAFLLGKMSHAEFDSIFRETAREKLISNFTVRKPNNA